MLQNILESTVYKGDMDSHYFWTDTMIVDERDHLGLQGGEGGEWSVQ